MSTPWPRSLHRVPRTRCCTSHDPLPKQKHEQECGGTFHSRWSTKTQHQKASEHVQVATKSKTIPTNTSSKDQATSMFSRLAIGVNCYHKWLTNSYEPPNRRTSINDDTFATTGNVASRAPDSSTFKSSAKRYPRSRTTRRLRRMCSFRRSSSLFTFTKGVSFKIQNPPPRSFQPQSLVTGKMLHPLIVLQDLMRAMRQHRDILSTNPTIGITRFASCIGSPSEKELTHFVRPPHLLHVDCAPWSHTTTAMTCPWFIGTRVTRVSNITETCSTLPQLLKNGI